MASNAGYVLHCRATLGFPLASSSLFTGKCQPSLGSINLALIMLFHGITFGVIVYYCVYALCQCFPTSEWYHLDKMPLMPHM
ncbi:hypothetical protein XELAEV_18046909mg [Xenopus laevis]|uniref:Uncharacterized protein n=1 Tax=Xenopus laevis TaxID=8355 RepID=A0A974BUQ1_XENLA|nr:hypothetical protein XELAEV_18046909mg [Xenopus laevis]